VRGEPLLCVVESLREEGGRAATFVGLVLLDAKVGRAATVGLDEGASVSRVKADMATES